MLEVVVGNVLKLKSMIADNGVIPTGRNTIPYWRMTAAVDQCRAPVSQNRRFSCRQTQGQPDKQLALVPKHHFPQSYLLSLYFFLPYTRPVSIPTSMSPSPSPISLNTIRSLLFDHG